MTSIEQNSNGKDVASEPCAQAPTVDQRRDANLAAARSLVALGVPVFLEVAYDLGPDEIPLVGSEKHLNQVDWKVSSHTRERLISEFGKHGDFPFQIGSTTKPRLLERLFNDKPDSLPRFNSKLAGIIAVSCQEQDAVTRVLAHLAGHGVDTGTVPQIGTSSGGSYLFLRKWPDGATVGDLDQFGARIVDDAIAPGAVTERGGTYVYQSSATLEAILDTDHLATLVQPASTVVAPCALAQIVDVNQASLLENAPKLDGSSFKPNLSGL